MTQTGFAKPLMTGEFGPASQVENYATNPVGTTNGATNTEFALRSCSDD